MENLFILFTVIYVLTNLYVLFKIRDDPQSNLDFIILFIFYIPIFPLIIIFNYNKIKLIKISKLIINNKDLKSDKKLKDLSLLYFDKNRKEIYKGFILSKKINIFIKSSLFIEFFSDDIEERLLKENYSYIGEGIENRRKSVKSINKFNL